MSVLSSVVGGRYGHLRALRVQVDVFLARQLHDLVHDLVGHGAEHDPVLLQPVVAGEVQRLAEPDTRPDPQPRRDLARRLELEAPDHGARDHWDPRLEGQPRDACLAAVKPPIRGPRALRVDAEQVALGQHPQPGIQRTLARGAAGPVHRNLTHTAEEGLAHQALQPAPGEVLRLGKEDHLARQRQRGEEVIRERQVVARDDRRSLSGDVVGTVRPWPEHDPEERPEYCLDHPVEHAHMFPRDRGPPTYAPGGCLRATMRWSGKRGAPDGGPRRGLGPCQSCQAQNPSLMWAARPAPCCATDSPAARSHCGPGPSTWPRPACPSRCPGCPATARPGRTWRAPGGRTGTPRSTGHSTGCARRWTRSL